MPYNLWLDIINEVKDDAGSILDIGSGTGELLKILQAKRKLGIDNSEEMIKIARENDPESENRFQDLVTMELAKQVELITATADVLHKATSKDALAALSHHAYNHSPADGEFH